MSDYMIWGSRQYARQLARLCEPLNEFFGITQVNYIEVTQQGNLTMLHTNMRWVERFVEQKYYLYDPHMIEPERMGSGFVTWLSYREQKYRETILRDGYNNYGLCHGISFVKKDSQGYKICSFSTENRNETIHNKLISNLDCINKFIAYYNKKIESIKKNMVDYQVKLPAIKEERYYLQPGIIEFNEIDQIEFLNQLELLGSNYNQITFSKREQQCIHLYLKGNSAASTAEILSLSPRTVESHMESIKKKMNLKFKKELFNKSQILKKLSLI